MLEALDKLCPLEFPIGMCMMNERERKVHSREEMML